METWSLFGDWNNATPGATATLVQPSTSRNIVIFDIETQKTFQDVGGRPNMHKLMVSAAVAYRSANDQYVHYTERNVFQLITLLQSADLVVGFNILGFDYPVLQPYAGGIQLRHLPTLDLMDSIYQGIGFRIGLNALAQATLGIKKSADGIQAVEWYRQGRMDEILKYCEQDVRVTKELFDFGHRQGYIYYENPNSHELIKHGVNW